MSWGESRLWKVTLVIACPKDNDASGLTVVLDALQYDEDATVVDCVETEMVLVEKGDVK